MVGWGQFLRREVHREFPEARLRYDSGISSTVVFVEMTPRRRNAKRKNANMLFLHLEHLNTPNLDHHDNQGIVTTFSAGRY